MTTRTSALLGALLLTAPLASVHAHATLDVEEAAAGTNVRLALRIPHGCDGQATHRVRVEMPDGFIDAKPMPKPGWTLTLEHGPYAQAYDLHGEPMADGVHAIIWAGGELPDAWYDEFVFRGRIAAELPAGTVLAFPSVQTCADGEVAWIELPGEGQSAHDLAHPAPVVLVAAPGNGGHGGHGGEEPAMPQPAAAVGDITISGVFARATAGRSGGAYLVIENRGEAADRLTAAESPVAVKTTLHEMTVVDDVMRMSEVQGGVAIPARGSVTLAPGGLHVMMMGLGGPLEEGATFPLTLTFERAGSVTLDVPVLGAAADGTDEHSGH